MESKTKEKTHYACDLHELTSTSENVTCVLCLEECSLHLSISKCFERTRLNFDKKKGSTLLCYFFKVPLKKLLIHCGQVIVCCILYVAPQHTTYPHTHNH